MSNSSIPNVITSKLFSLTSRDWLRGLAMAVISAALGTIYGFTQSPTGIHGIDWDKVIQIAVNSALGYILLNLGTGKQIIVNNPSDKAIADIKNGAPVEVAGNTVAAKQVSPQ